MALVILWTPEAENTYNNIIKYLEVEWSEKEVQNFIRESNNVLRQIAEFPNMFKASKKKDIRIGLITKQNSLIYRVKNKEIQLLSFWDNRQDPDKLKL